MEVKSHNIWRKIGLLWLLLVVIVVSSGLIIRDYRKMKYDDTLGINLVMIGVKKVAIVTLRREANATAFFLTPEKMVAGEADGSGKFRVGSLWGLGQIEKNPGGRVVKNLENELGIRFDSYIKVESDSELTLSGLLKSMLIVTDKSNLNLLDRLRIRSKLLELGEKGEISEETMPDNLFSIKQDPDGVENMIIDTEKARLWAEKVWVVPAILMERINMAVYNNTDVAGKGRAWARGMEIAGIKVVQIEKGGTGQKHCVYSVNRRDILAVVKMLEKTYNCQNSGFQPALSGERVDVEVQIGQD